MAQMAQMVVDFAKEKYCFIFKSQSASRWVGGRDIGLVGGEPVRGSGLGGGKSNRRSGRTRPD